MRHRCLPVSFGYASVQTYSCKCRRWCLIAALGFLRQACCMTNINVKNRTRRCSTKSKLLACTTSNLNLWGRTMPAGATGIRKERLLNFFSRAATVDFLHCLKWDLIGVVKWKHSRSRCGHGMAFSDRMRSTEMFSRYAWVWTVKHRSHKISQSPWCHATF